MNKFISIIILFFFVATVYAGENNNNAKTSKQDDLPEYKSEPHNSSSETKEGYSNLYVRQIASAYEENSKQKLEEFFQNWSDLSIPNDISKREMLPPAIRNAYEIYEDFYDPKNLEKIGDPEWGTDQFSHVSFYIIQPSISVAVTDKLKKDYFLSAKDTDFDDSLYYIEIKNFKPTIRGKTNAIFLDENRRYILETFLRKEELPMGTGNIMAPSRAIGDSKERQKFLNQCIQIFHGHWGGWVLPTGPIITTINFDKNFTEAIVHFSIVYQGGEAYYKYRRGEWKLKSSRLTWIQ